MKWLIVLLGVWGAFSANASSLELSPVLDYLPTEFDTMYEIKTNNYEKVVLDCQGYVMGLYFYNNGKYERQIVMSEGYCLELHQMFSDSKEQLVPVCLELDKETNSLEITNKNFEQCK